MIAALAIANGVYDEVQLSNRRDELNHVFDGLSAQMPMTPGPLRSAA